MTVKELIDIFKENGINACHLWAELEELPVAVFYETGEKYQYFDDTIDETALTVNIEYHTKNDSDNTKEVIKKILLDAGYLFSYRILYNREKHIIAHTFEIEMMVK